jgi:hypothetical protein
VGSAVGTRNYRTCSKYGNYRVVGLHGYADSRINKIGLICGSQFDSNLRIQLPADGADVGTPFSIKCQEGAFATAIWTRADTQLNQIKLVCK